MGERAPQCLRAVCGGSVPRLQSSWSTRGVMVDIIGTSKIVLDGDLQVQQLLVRAPRGAAQCGFGASNLCSKRLRPSASSTLRASYRSMWRLVVSIDPPGSPESSHSTTGRCPGLRYTSEVGGVRLPMWPGLRPIVYKVLSSNKVRPGTRLTGFLQLSYSRLTPSYLPRRS